MRGRIQMLFSFFVTTTERLEEVCICRRQRLRPNGHRLHTPLECFRFLKGVLYGAVVHCLCLGDLVADLLVEPPRFFVGSVPLCF